MVSREKAIEILNREKDYEERITKDLTDYFMYCVDDINELNEKERDIVEHHIRIISSDSLKHANLFGRLIDHVLEGEEKEY